MSHSAMVPNTRTFTVCMQTRSRLRKYGKEFLGSCHFAFLDSVLFFFRLVISNPSTGGEYEIYSHVPHFAKCTPLNRTHNPRSSASSFAHHLLKGFFFFLSLLTRTLQSGAKVDMSASHYQKQAQGLLFTQREQEN